MRSSENCPSSFGHVVTPSLGSWKSVDEDCSKDSASQKTAYLWRIYNEFNHFSAQPLLLRFPYLLTSQRVSNRDDVVTPPSSSPLFNTLPHLTSFSRPLCGLKDANPFCSSQRPPEHLRIYHKLPSACALRAFSQTSIFHELIMLQTLRVKPSRINSEKLFRLPNKRCMNIRART
jgi:hypothetical protein